MSEPRLLDVHCLNGRGLHRMAYWEWGDPANETVLQRLVGQLLHSAIHRRVNLDTSLHDVFNAASAAPAFKLLKDIFKDRGRLKHLVFAPRDHLNRALLG